MQLYLYHPNSNDYLGYMLRDRDHDLIKLHFSYQRVLEKWSKISLSFADNPFCKMGDFPVLSSLLRLPLFSQKAWEVYKKDLEPIAEALPVKDMLGRNFYLINIFVDPEIVDESRMEASYYRDGRVRNIEKFVINPTYEDEFIMLKNPRALGAGLFLTEKFKKLYEENNLQGLHFHRKIEASF